MIYIVYHGNCYDGFGSAFAAWLKHGESATYIPFYHGNDESVKILTESIDLDDEIYFLDMSLPLSDLEELAKHCAYVVVLDHHQTAIKDLGLEIPGTLHRSSLEKLELGLTCVLDLEESGATLAWTYFHASPVPEFFKYLRDRDLWLFEMPYSKDVAAALQAYPFEFEAWEEIYQSIGRLQTEGENILRFKEQMVENVCKHARIIFFERAPNPGGLLTVQTYQIPVTNSSLFFSEIPTRLLELFPDAPFALNYYRRGDGLWYYSLRSRPDFDVSEIAEHYGGGGHKQAAGFQLSTLIV